MLLSERIFRRDAQPKLVRVDGRVNEVAEYNSVKAPGSIRVTPSGTTTFEMYLNSW